MEKFEMNESENEFVWVFDKKKTRIDSNSGMKVNVKMKDKTARRIRVQLKFRSSLE